MNVQQTLCVNVLFETDTKVTNERNLLGSTYAFFLFICNKIPNFSARSL